MFEISGGIYTHFALVILEFLSTSLKSFLVQFHARLNLKSVHSSQQQSDENRSRVEKSIVLLSSVMEERKSALTSKKVHQKSSLSTMLALGTMKLC